MSSMPSRISLRPHHLLCLRFFDGRGYDQAFTDNARVIVERMRGEGPLIVALSPSCDDVCAACPHRRGDECRFARSVSVKDASVANWLRISPEGLYRASRLQALVESAITDLDDVANICGECEWSGVCNAKLSRDRGDR